MVIRFTCAGLLFLAGIAGASARDAQLDQAIGRPALPVTRTQGMIHTTTTVTGGDELEVETTTVDPRKEPKKALASYVELKDVIGADAHVVSRAAGRTTYAFTTHRVPRGFTDAGEVKVDMDGKDDDDLFDGKAELSIDANGQPYVSHLDLRMHDAANNLVARVKWIELSYAFAPDARTGAMVATAMSVDVDVRALLFVHRRAHVESVLVDSAGATATQ